MKDSYYVGCLGIYVAAKKAEFVVLEKGTLNAQCPLFIMRRTLLRIQVVLYVALQLLLHQNNRIGTLK